MYNVRLCEMVRYIPLCNKQSDEGSEVPMVISWDL